MQHKLVKAHALFKTPQKTTLKLKKLLLSVVAVVLLLNGCFSFDEPTYHKQSSLVGFASDTTAIIFSYDWESNSSTPCGIQSCGGGDRELDIELKLVDVRFKKVYWSSKIGNSYGYSFNFKQWNDSAIVFSGTKGDFLWEIGNSKPQKIDFTWNTEKEGSLTGSSYSWLRYKNDSILLVGRDYARDMVIDTKTKTVNSIETISDCLNWWGKEAGGGCLVKNSDSNGLYLISEKGDTLSSFSYTQECKNLQDFYTHRYFIYFNCEQVDGNLNAFIKYDEKGNLAKEPSFGPFGIGYF